MKYVTILFESCNSVFKNVFDFLVFNQRASAYASSMEFSSNDGSTSDGFCCPTNQT